MAQTFEVRVASLIVPLVGSEVGEEVTRPVPPEEALRVTATSTTPAVQKAR